MDLRLADDQVTELLALVESTLPELSHEIAATDNPLYRSRLVARRTLLEAARRSLEEATRAPGRSDRAAGARRRRPGGLRGRGELWAVEVRVTEDDDRTPA